MTTKTATKAPARPAGKANQLPPRQTAGSTPTSTQTKAQQAARAQGRPEPRTPEPEPRRTQPAEPKRTSVPATRPNAPPPADYGDQSKLPAFMRNDAGAGKEGIGRDDLETPRLKLMQGLSKELETYNDLRAGNFFHTASETIFDDSFVAVPVYMDRRYILWRPRDQGGGILARADDGVHWSPGEGEIRVKLDRKDGGKEVTWRLAKTVQQSGLANWGTMNPEDPNSPPAATLMYSYVLAFPEHPDLMPAVLTFQRSSIKQGRRFNTKLKTTRTPLFGLQFRFSPFIDHNGAGQEFYNVNVTGEGVVEDEALYNQYKAMHEGFKGVGLTIKDLESAQDEDTGQNEGDDDKPREGPNKY